MINKKYLKRLGVEMRALRKNAKLSQVKLGKILGYKNGQFVSNWERGDQLPPLNAIKKLCELSNASIEYALAIYLEAIREEWRGE